MINTLYNTKRVFLFNFWLLSPVYKQDKLKYAIEQYIAITKYAVTCVNNSKKHNISFDKTSLKLSINYLLNQCFFNVNSLTFRQIMDTAMGKNFRVLTINFLLDQCFFDVGSLTFHQIIGIPMGSSLAFFMINLFLFTYESKWLLDTKKSNLQKARKFTNTFGFEYVYARNDRSEFKKTQKKYTCQNKY